MYLSYNIEISKKPNKDNLHLLMLRVTLNKQHKRISTGIEIPLEDFNTEGGLGKWIRRTNPSYKKHNTSLEKFIEKAKDIQSEIESKNQVATLTGIMLGLRNDVNYLSFIDYADEKIGQYMHTKSYNYYKNSKSKLKNLKEFVKNRDLLFTDLDVTFLNRYETYLYSKKLAKNTVFTNLKVIRSIIYEAIKENKFRGQNPFLIKRLSQESVSKDRLTIEQIKKIQEVDLQEGSSLWHVRNYFLFSFFMAGIRVSDLIQLKWSTVTNTTDGPRLTYKMSKTSSNHSMRIPPRALEILDFYRSDGEESTGFIFPLLKNNIKYSDKKFLNGQISSKTAIINKNLKKIAEKIGIEINLSTHISRHSFADIMRQKKISIFEIKNLLGHSDTKVTEAYIASFDQNASDQVHMDVMGEF